MRDIFCQNRNLANELRLAQCFISANFRKISRLSASSVNFLCHYYYSKQTLELIRQSLSEIYPSTTFTLDLSFIIVDILHIRLC